MNLQLKRLEKRFDLMRYLEQFEFVMSGNNAVLTCPQCERDGKLYVLTEDTLDVSGEMKIRGTWICYYCRDRDGGGTGRTCLSLIEWLEDLEFLDAIRRLADGGTSVDADFIGAMEKAFASLEDEEADDKSVPIPTVALPKAFVPIDERHYPPYAAERGISPKRAMRFGLGYCRRGYYENRLIAPVFFEQRVVGFQARYMKKKPPIDPETGKRIKKTKHSKGAKLSRVFYNWDEAQHQRRVIVVESPWAVIKIGRQGAGSFGKHLSSAQLELLLRSNVEEIVFMWDRDADHAAGKGGYDKSVAFAEKLAPMIAVRCVRMPDSRDPDEHKLARLRKLIRQTPLLSANDAWLERTARWMED